MFVNRLAKEKSPYLLQHSNNPVDWFPWGDEAFSKAKKEDKPIFLSIGYSTCHWCHVMEHESFEDEEVANLMNETFVSIKVDREERPDIDGIYMTVCQMLTGSGGWPLTIIMTPDKKPFFAGTYFPKSNRFGRTGMMELIPKIKEVWKIKREEILNSAEQISSALMNNSQNPKGTGLTEKVLHKAYIEFEKRFDPELGGFGDAPKFPSPHNLFFLLRYWKRTGEMKALEMVKKTLTEMRKGGIYDQLGFGFHRYSTDREWLVPHFEKMLYDQALLAIAFIETYQTTKEIIFKKTAEEILEYVLRDMTSPDGGFYSAEDADSEAEEGKFYVWDESELREVLGEDFELFSNTFNCEMAGNWIDPTIGGAPGTNIFHLKQTLTEFDIETQKKIESARKILFEVREKRVHPYKDDKVLTDWNGLMISALAKAAQVFGNKAYSKTAKRSVEFTLKNMTNKEGKLLHRFRDSDAAISGNLDDYSFFIAGLIDLYESEFDAEHLETAIKLNGIVLKHFWDFSGGGFYFTPDDAEELLFRQKEIYDGAIPSGNSVMLSNLLRLGRFTGNTDYEIKAEELIKAFSNNISQMPIGYSHFLCGLDFALGESKEIVVAGKKSNPDVKKILNLIHSKFIPNKILIFKDAEKTGDSIEEISPFVKSQNSINGGPAVYICENYNCKMPVTNLLELEKELE